MIKKLLVFSFFLIFPLEHLKSQNLIMGDVKNLMAKIDSLQKLNKTVETDSLITLYSVYYLVNKLPVNEEVFESKIELFEKLNARSTFLHVALYEDFLKGSLYNQIGYYNLAYEKLNAVVLASKNIPHNYLYLYAYQEMSKIISLTLLNNPQKDRETRSQFYSLLRNELSNAKKLNDTLMISKFYLNMGLINLVDEDYRESRNYYRKSWEAVEANPRKFWFEYYGGKWAEGLCLLHLNETKKGFELVNMVKNEAQKFEYNDRVYLRQIIGLLLGRYYIEKKQFDLALSETQYALKANRKLYQPFFEHFLNKNLYHIYKHQGKYNLALEYLEKINNFNSKLEDIETKERYSIWRNQKDNIEKDALIKKLEVENLVQKTNQQYLIRNLLIFGFLITIFIIIYIIRINRALYTKNKLLIKKNNEIEYALLEGKNIERKRVASELHDILSTKISSLKWQTEVILQNFEGKHKAFIQGTIDSLEELYTDVRFISHNLLPEELVNKGLYVALFYLVEKLNSLNKTKFNLVIRGNEKISLEPIVQYELYNVILELCNNILKHAKADNAHISISEFKKSLYLFVNDDGIGILNSNKPKGIGHINIKNRIQSLGGELFIESNSKGTYIKIIIKNQ